MSEKTSETSSPKNPDSKSKKRIPIDSDLRPAYYDDFHCLAAGCKWNCCKHNWTIKFSKKDYLLLKRQDYSPEMKKLIEQGVRRIRTNVRGGGGRLTPITPR